MNLYFADRVIGRDVERNMDKRIILGGLVAASLMTNSFAADITYYGLTDGYSKINSINFSDVLNQGDGYWAKPAIYQIASMGIMSGFSSTSFSPTSAVTNEQAVTTILNATGKAKDVDNLKMVVNNWSDKYIKYAMNEGLITEKIVYKKADVKGNIDALKEKGVFIRDIPITREEVATLIYRAFELSSGDSSDNKNSEENKNPIEFLDKALIDEDRIVHVDAVSQAGIMVGDESGMFNPKSNLTRAEFAQVFKNCEDYLLKDLNLTKRSGFIDSVSSSGFELTDDDGNVIAVNCSGRDIPIIRNNRLSGISGLKNSDEVEFFIDTSKQVVFLRVIDEGIYSDNSANSAPEAISKQGIVVGNSPYFYEISIKDKNGSIENYEYGAWTNIYKDGKESTASNILQGDTVYLEFDEIGDLVVIRGVTNAVITYGTIIDIDGNDVTFKMDSDNSSKEYNLRRIPVYENGAEISIDDLTNGKYAKIYSSASELIKIEIVIDERTAENLYKGYISEVNLIQDRIILRNPKIFRDGKWESAESSFITIPLDNDMRITYDGEEIEKDRLGEKQVGKFAYIVTRQDTMVLEKAKVINIELKGDDENTIVAEVRSYNSSSGLLKLYNDSRKLYIDEYTISVIDGKISPRVLLEKGDKVSITSIYDDGEYIVKMISDVEILDEKEVEVYYGVITDIESGEEISVELSGRFEGDEWDDFNNRHASFTITSDTRIFSETEPLTFKEFDNTYEDKKVAIIAYGDEAISIGIMELSEKPYISVGSVKEVSGTEVSVQDVEYFDHKEEDWVESDTDEKVTINVNTLITRNGNFARSSDINKDQEVIIIRKDATSAAGVVLLVE